MICDYVLEDTTRISVWEARDVSWNYKRSPRLHKKMLRRWIASAQYVKVPIGFWEQVTASGTPTDIGYIVYVADSVRFYWAQLTCRDIK